MKPTIISNQQFYGGISTDEKIGIEHSHAYSRAVDFRKKPGRLSPLPEAVRIGSNNIVDLIQQIVQTNDGTRYGLGDQGNFYKIDTSNGVVVEAKLDNGATGMLYRKDVDELYCTSLKTVSRYGKFATSPTMSVNKYAESVSTDDACTLSGGTESYTVPTTIAENATGMQEFEADIEPLNKIRVKVNTKGTGNWTLTLHDDANNLLGTSTVATANITSGQYLDFSVTTPLRLYIKPSARTYHFHLTSTVADGTVFCSTASDLNTCDYDIWADRLVSPNNGLHPMVQFLQYNCIGNERYLSVWEPLSDTPSNLEWNRHRLDFGSGYEVCGLTTTDEYLVIAVERRSSSTSKDFQEGKLFFWDGLSEAYNFSIDVNEGSPESLYTYQNLVYLVVNGALYVWAGGKNIVKVRTLLGTDTELSSTSDTTRVYPNMMAVRRGILTVGYPSITSSTAIEHGVFSWGSIDKNYPMSFGNNYCISTKTRFYAGGNALRIGSVRSFGDSLYISWRDDSQQAGFRYGLDVINNSSPPASEGTWEARIFDGEAVFKQKIAQDMKLTCSSIPTGVRIKMKYSVDRGAWVYPDDGVLTSASSPNTYKIADINLRNHEVQIGFDWDTPDSSTPATEPFVVTGMALNVDLLTNETPFTET